jgi:prepilin-type N-terminal cleavage/methylation domain-containing protein
MRRCTGQVQEREVGPVVDLNSRGSERRGFTMIELLIVVVIIGILTSLLLPTIGTIREKARNKATRALVEGLSAALTRYNNDFDEYPPSTVGELGDPGSPQEDALFRYLCGPDGQGITKVTGSKKRTIEPYINIPPEFLKKGSDNRFYVVDAWGSEIVYKNSKAYVDAMTGGNVSQVFKTDKVMNPSSFDLYSKGPDRKEDPDRLRLVDDIANWSQVQDKSK